MINIAFKKITLANGLDVILHEDHALPLVAVNVWYHVGSKDEQPGRTGFAHLFEHIMFDGSKNHNRSFFDPLQRVGGSLNGSTTRDRTNYWENLPANELELALWLESDRMGFLLDALDQKRFETEREVVHNERRQSYENRPYGMTSIHIQEALFPPPHPYHWNTIGIPADLDAATLDDVKAFFTKHYAPNNASLTIAGDINSDETLRLVERYFGDIPPQPAVPRVTRRESDLTGAVDLTITDKVQLPRLYLSWPSPGRFHQDDATATVMSTILGSGKRSRLFRSLEYEKQIVQEVMAFHFGGEIAGQLQVIATPAPGHTIAEVQDAVERELERMRREPPTEEELTGAKNGIEAMHVRQLERLGGFGGRADQLNAYNVFAGDPGKVNTDLDDYMKIRPEDVQRVAASLLTNRRVQLVVQPEPRLATGRSQVDRTVQPPGQHRHPFSPPAPARRRLSNGVNVLVVPMRGLPLVSVGAMLSTGAMTDPASLPGLAHVVGELLQEGTETRTSQQLAAELEFIGAELSVHPERVQTLVSATALTKNWTKALELQADIVLHPTFPHDEFTRIRKQLLTDLARAKDDATRIANRLYPELLYGRATPLGHPLTGNEDSVARMTQEDLVRHHRASTGPRSTTLLVVGDVSVDEAMGQLEQRFGQWTGDHEAHRNGAGPLPDPRAKSPTLYLVDKPGAAQSVIHAGHLSVPRHHPDFAALTLLNYAFGGHFGARLNANLRQAKGYSYGYRSFISWMRDSSYLLAGGSVHTAVTKESIAETLKEFADVRVGRPITKEELEDARMGLLRSLPSTFETTDQLLGRLVQLVEFNLPDDYFATIAEKFESVTLDDVHRVARDLLLDQHLTLLTVGDRAKIEPGLKELGLPLVHLDHEGAVLPS